MINNKRAKILELNEGCGAKGKKGEYFSTGRDIQICGMIDLVGTKIWLCDKCKLKIKNLEAKDFKENGKE